jgi:formylglycine-generating enzyme required for sulfatase activity
MDQILKSLGFTVETLMNGSRSTMRTKLKELKDNLSANPGGIGFVYYIGDGFQVDGENYLVPVNQGSLTSEAAVKEICLSLSYVLEMSKGTQAKVYVTIFDTYGDNSLLGQRGDGNKSQALVARVLDTNNLVEFVESSRENTSPELCGAKSVYTAESISKLLSPNESLQDVLQPTYSTGRSNETNKQRCWEQNRAGEHKIQNWRDEAFVVPNPFAESEPPLSPVARVSNTRFVSSAIKIREKYPLLADYVESLCVIPAGEFQMGGNIGKDEAPIHKVSLSSFGLGATPVTVGLWKEYASSKLGGQMPPEPNPTGINGARKFNIGWSDLDHPIVNVSWEDCRKFCTWASEVSSIAIDLPSEAQWEYACRGGRSGIEFPWGKAPSDESLDGFLKANVWCSNSKPGDCGGTGSVYRTTRIWRNHRWGVADMVGNVWEWCLDWYDPQFYGRPSARSFDVVNRISAPPQTLKYSGGTKRDVACRCLRGGSWIDDIPDFFRCAYRGYLVYDNRYELSDVGFRIAAGPG